MTACTATDTPLAYRPQVKQISPSRFEQETARQSPCDSPTSGGLNYTATIETNTRPITNPARVTARDHLKHLQAERDQHRQRIGAAHTDRTLNHAALNRELANAQAKIHKLDKRIIAAENALKTIPAKLPANLI